MNPLSHPRSLALTVLLGSLALSGCSSNFNAIGSAVVSNPVSNPLVQGFAIKGSAYGGHSPITGAHIYVLQPAAEAAGGLGQQATSLLKNVPGSTTKNTTDTGIPNTWYYVTSAPTTGNFNITGDYTCTANQPVYLYLTGGNTGNTTADATNPAITQLAILGNCPSSDNFTSSISFVYMNEVSTVAAAYAFQGFTVPATSASSGNNATYIGSSNSAQGLKGIENAANTAAELYNIQGGGPESSNVNGEGHIANATTIAGNGIVPEAMIDTLANILAGCIDSNNTAATKNAACSTLFAYATSDGTYDTATGIVPIDTATAAINIARNPAGTNSPNFMSKLYGLQASTGTPYVPDLTKQPNDFTLGILYPSTAEAGASANSELVNAESIAVDGNGYVWMTAQSGPNLFQWTPQGVLNAGPIKSTGTTPGSTTPSSPSVYGYVAIGATNNDAWTGNENGLSAIERFSETDETAPPTETSYDGVTNGFGGGGDNGFGYADVVLPESDGNVFFTATNGADETVTCIDPVFGFCLGGTTTTPGGEQQSLFEISADGDVETVSNLNSSNFGTNQVSHGAADASNYLWLTSEGATAITRVSATGVIPTYSYTYNCGTNKHPQTCTETETSFPISTPAVAVPKGTTVYQPQPEFPAIDGSGNAWIPIQSIYSSTANPNTPGAFVINPDGSTITELYSGTGTNSSTTSNVGVVTNIVYTGANFYQSFGAAIDGSGNVWIANRCNTGAGATCTAGNGNSSLIELNGAGATTPYTAISPATTNYSPEYGTGATPELNDALNLAIDPSGNVWITNVTSGELVEVVGAATPVVTPLAAYGFGQTP